MKKAILLFLFFLPLICFASGDDNPIALEKAHINVHDKASLLRGAKSFKKLCMTCHALRLLEFNPLAKQAGITLDLMPTKDKEWWFAKAPPDLSLAVRQHGADWIYTYMQVFYKDPSVKTANNNLLLPNTSMPNIFLGLQGQQILNLHRDKALSDYWRKPHYYSVLKKSTPGSLSNEQFEQMATDITNFLAYAAEPAKLERERTGVWVILFLMVFLVLAYFLKREYWKDIE
jgi:ubiquinol-cytochrome c reductase cytochrome c1 subunit